MSGNYCVTYSLAKIAPSLLLTNVPENAECCLVLLEDANFLNGNQKHRGKYVDPKIIAYENYDNREKAFQALCDIITVYYKRPANAKYVYIELPENFTTTYKEMEQLRDVLQDSTVCSIENVHVKDLKTKNEVTDMLKPKMVALYNLHVDERTIVSDDLFAPTAFPLKF